MKHRSTGSLIAFLGPSLPAAQVRRLYHATVLPPARQGDVWRALARGPRAIALIDGVFESQPSVWHHELLAALDAGVAVFGGASMGALRAAELESFGMVGVGQIFRWVRDGVVVDDSEVALLHAGAEHGHRPLTLPLVNVRHAAAKARLAGVLSAAEARDLVTAASRIFYQKRHWPGVLEAAAPLWRRSTEPRWRTWAASGLEDLKALDAHECLRAAAEFVAADPPRSAPTLAAFSSLVRRRRLHDVAPEALEHLSKRPDAVALAERGLTRLLLAGWARTLGLHASAARLRRAECEWLRRAGVSKRQRKAFLAAAGLDEAQAARLIEDLALESLVLDESARMLPDGPGRDEGLALEAQLWGLWNRPVRPPRPRQCATLPVCAPAERRRRASLSTTQRSGT